MSVREALGPYADVFRVAPVGLYLYRLEDPADDASLRLIDANEAAAAFTGVANAAIVGKRIDEAFPGLRDAGFVARFHAAIRDGAPADFGEFTYAEAAGRAAGTYRCQGIPLADGASIAVCFENVTATRAAERAAVTALAAAEEASRAKSRFLANMSHELRTPLNAIIGYTELVLEEDAEGGAADLPRDLGRALGAARHLLRLIDDVLDLAKVEAGHLAVALEPVDLEALVREAADAVRPQLLANGNALVLDVQAPRGPFRTDPVRLLQVLINLLGNAGKFTADGRVALTLRAADGEVAIAVADSGIGMTAAQLERLFAPFEQTDAEVARRFGGTGLGLAITRAIVERLGGAIEVRSTPEAGSTFTGRLPIRP